MSEPAKPIVPANPNTAFETEDWRILPVVLALLGVLLVMIVALLVLRFSIPAASPDARRPLTVEMPRPRLQVAASVDLAALRAREDRDLNTYYWIDRDKGIVHIPIEAAMQQVAAHGLDGFPTASPK